MVRTRSMGGAVMQRDAKMVHLVRRYSTRQEWSEWLKAPLDRAAKAGDLEVVEALVDSGADMNGVFGAESDTALHVAAAWGRPAVVQALVRAGADTENKNRRGSTALRLACSHGHSAVVQVLLGAGASVDAYTVERWHGTVAPLRDAALGGHAEVVRQLLDAGAAVDARSAFGDTALHDVSRRGHTELMQQLVDAGSNVEAREDDRRYTPLLVAAVAGCVAAGRFLLGVGADTEARDVSGLAPLHAAAARGFTEFVEVLLEAGADVDARSQRGLSPLHLACTYVKRGSVEVLLHFGADELAADNRGNTPDQLIGDERCSDSYEGHDAESQIGVMLQNAPVDRAWRRRGWLVMMRARGAGGGGVASLFAEVVGRVVGLGDSAEGPFRHILSFL